MREGDRSSGEENQVEKPSRKDDWVEEALRLTRLARIDSSNSEKYKEERDEMVNEKGYRTRIREEDDVLVLYPEDWIKDGEVRIEKIDEKERAAELPIDPKGREWEKVKEENDSVLEEFSEAEGVDDDYVYNARSFAEFLENHYTVSFRDASEKQIDGFVNDYYERNVWPPQGADEKLEDSIKRLFEFVGNDVGVAYFESEKSVTTETQNSQESKEE